MFLNKIKNLLKNNLMKYFLFFLLTYNLCFAQAFLSFLDLKNEPSSTCMECSFVGEISGYSLMILVIPLIIFFLRNVSYKIILTLILFFVICFFINYSILVSRMTSWSSFTLGGEILGTISASYIYLPISTFGLFLVLKFTNFFS